MSLRLSRECVRGVALLEVLISVSLLTMGMGTTLRAMGTCARTQSQLEAKACGRALAEQAVADFKLKGSLGQAGDISGQFDAPFADYSWSARSYDATESFPLQFVELKIWRAAEPQRRLVYSTRTLAW